MKDWQLDKAWSDKFIPAIKQIVGPLLLVEAPMDVDQTQATDLIVLSVLNLKIAARVRSYGYAEKYPHDFTIRRSRDSGAKTELAKIIEGFGHWMFYGHANKTGVDFCKWMLIDLVAFRAHIAKMNDAQKKSCYTRERNRDGTTTFCAFDIRKFIGNPKILVAKS